MSVFRPEDYGAVGDGVTDDQPAFDLMNAALDAAGGGIVELAQGKIYLAGKQTPNSPAPYGGSDIFYQAPAWIIGLMGTSGSHKQQLIVEGNGATLKFKGGLKFGSFDPATGLPWGSDTDQASRGANIGWGVFAYFVDLAIVRNVNFDGNFSEAVLGSEWRGPGHQAIHNGISMLDCGVDSGIEGCSFRQFGLDGVVYSRIITETDAAVPAFIHGNSFTKIGRNAISLTGGRQIDVARNFVDRVGEADHPAAPNGIHGSNPKSCLDAEPEATLLLDVTIRDNIFIAGDNGHTAFATDYTLDPNDPEDRPKARRITLERNLFGGIVFPYGPEIIMKNNRIHGRLIKIHAGQADTKDNILVSGGLISDQLIFGMTTLGAGNAGDGSALDTVSGGPGATVRDLTLEITRHPVDLGGAILRDVRIDVTANTSTLANQAAVIARNQSDWENVTVYDRIDTSPPADSYEITGKPYRTENCRIVSPASKIKWYRYSYGYAGMESPNEYSFPLDPTSLAAGAAFSTPPMTIEGFYVGDQITASFSLPLQGTILRAEATGNHSVTIHHENPTSSTVNLGSGTVYLISRRPLEVFSTL